MKLIFRAGLSVVSRDDTIPERHWGKPAIYMSQVTVTCLSVHHFQHQGQTAQQRTELCPTALSVMLGHSVITLLLHDTGQTATPPYTHTYKYTHTHTFGHVTSQKFTCHSTFNNHRLHVGTGWIITARARNAISNLQQKTWKSAVM